MQALPEPVVEEDAVICEEPELQWIDFDLGVWTCGLDEEPEEPEDPTALWENNCDPTLHDHESGIEYWGGEDECGIGHDVWRTFEDSMMPAGTH
jgi:hypothetical protein